MFSSDTAICGTVRMFPNDTAILWNGKNVFQ